MIQLSKRHHRRRQRRLRRQSEQLAVVSSGIVDIERQLFEDALEEDETDPTTPFKLVS